MNLNTNLKVPLFLPFYTFIYLHIPCTEKWHSFDIPSWELCINALSLRYELIKEPERFFNFFTAKKCIVSPLGPFYRMKWQSFLPFHMLQVIKSLPFHIPEAWKRYPFWVEPLRIILREYLPHPPPTPRDSDLSKLLRPCNLIPRVLSNLFPGAHLFFLWQFCSNLFFFHGFSCSVKFCWYFVVKI